MKRSIVLFVVATALAGLAHAEGATEQGARPGESVYTYSVFFNTDELFEWWDNPKDIVTPYFETKFGLKIDKDRTYWLQGQRIEQRINAFIATNSWPDVFVGTHGHFAETAPMSKDLTELLPVHMPTYWKTRMAERDRQLSTYNGRVYHVYKYDGADWSPESLKDPYKNGWGNSLQIREDILYKLGYKFTPLREIQERCQREKRAVTLEDLRIEPNPYTTFDEFAAFLRKIRDANISDPAGKPVIPFTTRWGIQILGAGHGFSNVWVWNPKTKKAEGFLGSEGAKGFLRWWWKAYREGLIDPDYVIQTNTQLEEKVNGGRAALWMEPNHNNVQKSLLRLNPAWYVRPMPNPANDPKNMTYWYPYTPGYFAVSLKKCLPDDLAIRFLKMWDYMYSDDGIRDLIYGPASAGHRTARSSDGRVVFTPAMQALYDKKDKTIENGPVQLGLMGGAAHRWGDYWSRIAYFSAAPRVDFGLGPTRAFDPRPDVLSRARRLFDSTGMALDGSAASPVGEAPTATANYWNSTFKYNDITELLNAKTEQEFDKAWTVTLQKNETIGRYTEPVKVMTEVFNARGYK